jgi:hypothetical protein
MKMMWCAATLAIMAGVVLMGLILTPFVAISDGLDPWRIRGGSGDARGPFE